MSCGIRQQILFALVLVAVVLCGTILFILFRCNELHSRVENITFIIPARTISIKSEQGTLLSQSQTEDKSVTWDDELRNVLEKIRNFRLYLVVLAVMVLVSLTLVYIFVRSSVISRILAIRRELIEYNPEKADRMVAVKETGDDELTLLAAEINFCLGQIQQREQRLQRAAREAEAASEAKSAFVAAISHEIRTPMNSIINLTKLCLGAELATTLDSKRKYWLEIVRRSSESLLDLTNDILDSAKVEAGKMELNLGVFSLSDLLEKLEPYKISAQMRGLDFQVDVENEMPQHWYGDQQRIGQILINLVSNAIKFTESGGVKVELYEDNELYGNNQECLLFRVSDTGIGIRDDKLRSIFGPYQQEAHSAMRSGGTGLGLCIAQQLAMLMKGSIQAEPKLPQGSVFQVLLPLPSVAEEKNQVACEPENGRSFPERFNSERILLVDDNPFNLLVAEELMKLAGLTVDTAEDGVEAVEMVRTKRYDLVLMDLNMPQMDGIEASVVIRGFPDCTDLPIIALTADANASTRQRCLSNGMNDVVTKPIDPSSFCNALTHWLPNKSTEMNKSASGETCAPEEALQDELHVPNEPEETVAPLLDNPVILQAFVHNHGKTVQRIHQALTGGEREEAHRQAHNLKSAAGAIGAPELNRFCEELEERLSNATAVNKDFEGDLVAQVGDEHLKVLERIARYQGREKNLSQ